jgi:hypothetical protein
MSERTMILSSYVEKHTMSLPKGRIETLFGILIKKFDALSVTICKWTNL